MHNLTVPDFLPILSSGAHDDPKEGACVMEMASFLAGEAWSGHPACTHPVIASMARKVNDLLDDAGRQRLLDLLPRVMGTSGGAGDRVLSVRLAVWCARQVSHLNQDPRVAAAIAASEAWADCPCAKHDAADTAAAVAAAASYAASYASSASASSCASASYASYAAYAASYASYAAYAASSAASSAYASYASTYAAANGDLIALLAGLIDEYDRLTGRTAHPDVTTDDLARIREHITA